MISTALDLFLLRARGQLSTTLLQPEIAVSRPVADELLINVNDSINIYFISPETSGSSVRRLKVTGIFKTGIEEFDKTMPLVT